MGTAAAEFFWEGKTIGDAGAFNFLQPRIASPEFRITSGL